MPDIISGTTLSTSPNQDQFIISMVDMAKKLYEDSFPFETLLRKLNGVQTRTRKESNWREHQLMGISTVVSTAAAANATSIPVSTPSLARRNMRVFCPYTREAFVVDEDIGGTAVPGAIKVRRQSAATGTGIVTAIPAGKVLLFGSTAQYEGEGLNPSFATKEVTRTAYIQEMQETIALTNIAINEAQYGEKERDKQRRAKAIEQMQRLNATLYWGRTGREVLSSPSGERTDYMPGLVDRLSPTAIDASAIVGGVTLSAIGEMLRPMRSYGIGDVAPVALCGTNVHRLITSWPQTYLRETTGERKAWGITVNRLLTANGPLDIVPDVMLSEDFGGEDLMFIITPSRLQLTELQGVPLSWKTNVQNPTEAHNIVRDLYYGSRGFEIYNAELHQMVYGIA